MIECPHCHGLLCEPKSRRAKGSPYAHFKRQREAATCPTCGNDSPATVKVTKNGEGFDCLKCGSQWIPAMPASTITLGVPAQAVEARGVQVLRRGEQPTKETRKP